MYFSHTKWFYGDMVTLRMSVLETKEMTQKIKELAVQAWWLEFDPQNPHKKSDAVACIDQPSNLSSSGPANLQSTVAWRTRDPAWNRVEGESQLLKDVLWPPHPHIHVPAHLHIVHIYIMQTHTFTRAQRIVTIGTGKIALWSRSLAGKLWIPDLRSLTPIGEPSAARPAVIPALGCQRQEDLYWSASLNQMANSRGVRETVSVNEVKNDRR